MDFVPRYGKSVYALIRDCDAYMHEEKFRPFWEAATKAFMDLVDTMNRQRFRLDKFGSHSSQLWHGVFSIGSGLWNCASLFQNLTSVYICITITFNLEDTKVLKKDAKEGRIFKFLSFALNLRILSFDMTDSLSFPLDEIEDGRPEISLLDILSRSYVCKRLHTFKLIKFPINPIKAEDLLAFLGRHARTLKCLHFDDIELYGTCREVLEFLKEEIHLTGLKLDHVAEIHDDHELLEFYGTNERRRMEDYVLHG
ncbi:hypothetical protein RUND412_009611, partial [Rhizina undulata]